jgi:hypothetical protein
MFIAMVAISLLNNLSNGFARPNCIPVEGLPALAPDRLSDTPFWIYCRICDLQIRRMIYSFQNPLHL